MYAQLADDRSVVDPLYESYFRAVDEVKKLEEDEALAASAGNQPFFPVRSYHPDYPFL